MDMNPFANNNQQTMSQTPDYLKQNPRANASVPGAVSNMVKAIMDGSSKFQQRNGMSGLMGGTPGSAIPGATGPTSLGGTGGPMPLMNGNAPVVSAPLTSTGPSPGSDGATQTIPSSVRTAMEANTGSISPMVRGETTFDSGASPVPYGWSPGIMAGGMGSGLPGMPNGSDRSMTALFSQIPRGGMLGG